MFQSNYTEMESTVGIALPGCTYVSMILGQTNSSFNVQSYPEKQNASHETERRLASLSSFPARLWHALSWLD